MERKWGGALLGALLALSLMAAGCAGEKTAKADQKQTGIKQAARVQQKNWPGGVINLSRARVRITLGDKVLWASVEDNATAHALVGELPITLALKDLDGQTAVYYQDVDQFPTDNLQMGGYKAGDIVFWPEKDRFVLFYKSGGPQFTGQVLGHVEGDLQLLAGNQLATFDLFLQ